MKEVFEPIKWKMAHDSNCSLLPPGPGDGFVLEGDEDESCERIARPEDSIPDLPENRAAREFLRTAPTKGLFMPLGKEVKVMQCWRCKAYGHRSGDRECPMRESGSINVEMQRRFREDPMAQTLTAKQHKRKEKYERVDYLKQLVEEIRVEERERKRHKSEKKELKKQRKEADC